MTAGAPPAVSGEPLVAKYFPGTGATYDGVVRWTTLGLDARWKRALLDRLPPSSSILELACGTGILTGLLLERHPGARLVGVDITEDYLRVARARHEGKGRDVRFVLGDAVAAPIAGQAPYDLVVSCYLPKYVDPDRLLDHLSPHLAPGAVVALQDFDRPKGVLPRCAWRAWFAFLDLCVPVARPEWKNVFDHSLVGLISGSRWPRRFADAFVRHGYRDVRLVAHSWRCARTVLAHRPS